VVAVEVRDIIDTLEKKLIPSLTTNTIETSIAVVTRNLWSSRLLVENPETTR
jgi:hypothetical protein